MSQILKEPEQEFKKVWQILDHCIRTNTFKQIKYKFSDGKKGRCVAGVIYNYIGWIGPAFTPDFELDPILKEITMLKYNFGKSDQCPHINFCDTEIPKVLQSLKKLYSKTGVIDVRLLAGLNDIGFTFEQFRDLFKEMNV